MASEAPGRAVDRGAARRAISYFRALRKMGFLEIVCDEDGSSNVRMTRRGAGILAHLPGDGEPCGICELCGGPIDPAQKLRIERTLACFEQDYGLESAITLCCPDCLSLPDYLLGRVTALLRRWYSGGRPRCVRLESWVVGEMEITGHLDALYTPPLFTMHVQPRRHVDARGPAAAMRELAGAAAGTDRRG